MGQEKLAHGGTTAVVVVAVALLAAWFIGPPPGTAAQRQNRVMAEFPSAQSDGLADVATFRAVDAALSDRLRLKPAVVQGMNSTVLGLTGRSPSKQVVAGDGLLFYAGEFTEPCLSTEYTLWARNSMRTMQEAAREGGKRLLFVVVPSKSVYVPKALGVLGRGLRACQRASRQVLTQLALEPDSPVVLLEPENVERAAEGAAYWRTDTHWTPAAGRALTVAISDRVEMDVRNRFGPGQPFDHVGDLSRMLGDPLTEPTEAWEPTLGAKPAFETISGGPYPVTAFRSPEPVPGAPSLLMVYDSFVYATGLEEQVASVFPRGWLVPWDGIGDVGNAGQAELVVIETVDRIALQRLAGFNPGGPNQPFLDYLATS